MATFLRRDDWVTDAMGNAISGANVYVCSQPATTGSIPPSPLVQIYADSAGVTPITQPLVADGYGHTFFYVAPGTYTIVYNSPQILTQVLADQTIGAGNVSFPITVAEGGTNATAAGQARINLGTAASGANSDITSMNAIGSTGGTTTTSTFSASGWQFGAGTFGTAGTTFAQVANQAWLGSGFTGMAMGVQDSGDNFALVTTSGFMTNGLVSANFIHCLGTLEMSVGNSILSDSLLNVTPGNPVTIGATGISGAGSVSVSIAGNGTLGQGLLQFSNYPTQTTVGSAGGASAPPATPIVWIPVKALVAGVETEVVLPAYKPS